MKRTISVSYPKLLSMNTSIMMAFFAPSGALLFVFRVAGNDDAKIFFILFSQWLSANIIFISTVICRKVHDFAHTKINRHLPLVGPMGNLV